MVAGDAAAAIASTMSIHVDIASSSRSSSRSRLTTSSRRRQRAIDPLRREHAALACDRAANTLQCDVHAREHFDGDQHTARLLRARVGERHRAGRRRGRRVADRELAARAVVRIVPRSEVCRSRSATLAIDKPLLLWINDGLMAVFFFLIGLEVKREMLEGELREPSQIVLPGCAALGGFVVPAAIYAYINWNDPVALAGWAIPAATDIAFALGVLSMLGSRAAGVAQAVPDLARDLRRHRRDHRHRAVLRDGLVGRVVVAGAHRHRRAADTQSPRRRSHRAHTC